MPDQKPSQEGPLEYRYRLLRYVPNQISGEFYNIAVVVYDPEDRIIDARFAPDFRRMRCNPAVEIDHLVRMRDEFEEKLLLGEDFSGYLESLIKDASNSIEPSDAIRDHWTDVSKNVDRLVRERLATPVGLEEGREDRERRPGARRAVRLRMTEVFARHGLFRNGHGVQRDVSVGYGGAGLKFVFDFQYEKPSSGPRFVHAVGLRTSEEQAARLCFVIRDYRARSGSEAGVTAVADDALGDDVRNLLADSGIATIGLSVIDRYAESIKAELGL